MMDNKIVIVGKKYDDGTKMIYLFFKKSFSWTMLNNSRNIVMELMSPPPPSFC
jgi:hypothetical protein